MVAATSVLVKGWLVCVAAVIEVLLYRSAFPADADERSSAASPAVDAASAAEPFIDSRPRMTCPSCAELVLTEARVCRFCGYRFADKLAPQ